MSELGGIPMHIKPIKNHNGKISKALPVTFKINRTLKRTLFRRSAGIVASSIVLPTNQDGIQAEMTVDIQGHQFYTQYISLKANTHDAICIIRFFCAIMLETKEIIYESVNLKGVAYKLALKAQIV